MQGPVRDPEKVRTMFDAIARRYDVANTLMSLGRDARWRGLAAEATGASAGDSVLDCACGSGSLCLALRRRGVGRVIGLDFSPRMLELARRRVPGVEFVEGDATRLPFDDASFAAVTIGFGLRNLPDPHAGIREMSRVVRPGGSLVILEAVRPTGPVAPFLKTWVTGVIPRLGGLISGDAGAYRYLGATVSTYATDSELGGWLAEAGMAGVHVRRLMFGTVALARGIKPAS